MGSIPISSTITDKRRGHSTAKPVVRPEPDRFFAPPYVGPKGWVGLRLDVDLDWEEVAAIVEDAWRLIATKNHLAERDGA